MATDVETVRGTHYEMGVQHGRAYRHVIRGNVHAYAMRHDFQGRDEELDEGLKKVRESAETFTPWVFEELRGIAKGSGVEYSWILRMHLRVWNVVPKAPPSPGGCTGIGVVTEKEGGVIGGNLDDPRQSYALIRRFPQDGIPHVMSVWVGAAWGHNGTNEAGLCTAEASLGSCEPAPSIPPGQYLLGSMTGRLLLETCRDVPEAVALLKKIRPTDSLILGDAKGNLMAVQSMGPYQAFEKPADGMAFCTNHIFMAELLDPLRKQGCKPVISDYSRVRFETLEQARSSLPRTSESVRQLLRSHRGFPHSICNEGTVFSTIAKPQAEPARLYVADRPPCRNDYSAYEVSAGR